MCVRTVVCKVKAASEDIKGESMSALRVFGFGFLGGVKLQQLPLVTLSDVREIDEASRVPFDAEQPLEFRFHDIGRT